MIPIRYNELPKIASNVFDLAPTHPLVNEICPGCDEPFGPDVIVLVPIGPGPDPETREKARTGRWHSAMTVPVHLRCSGYEREEVPSS